MRGCRGIVIALKSLHVVWKVERFVVFGISECLVIENAMIVGAAPGGCSLWGWYAVWKAERLMVFGISKCLVVGSVVIVKAVRSGVGMPCGW